MECDPTVLATKTQWVLGLWYLHSANRPVLQYNATEVKNNQATTAPMQLVIRIMMLDPE